MLYYNLGISDTKKQVSEPSYKEISRVLEDKIKENSKYFRFKFQFQCFNLNLLCYCVSLHLALMSKSVILYKTKQIISKPTKIRSKL